MKDTKEMNEAMKNELEMNDLEKVSGGVIKRKLGRKLDPTALQMISKANRENQRQVREQQEEERNRAE